jgi:spore germination cell wall hydrolase CwlJ-like protein
MKITHDDVDTLARTIYGEARGENMLGKRAVAHVILNRVKANSWWGKTIAGVCRYKWQFSCWNKNDPNRPKLLAVGLGDAAFRECMMAALLAVSGQRPDPTSGATHYHTKSVSPKWAEGQKPCRIIGVHKFYKGIK